MSRFVVAGSLGGLCCLVLAVRVFVAMDPERIRVVSEPRTADSRTVRLMVDDDRLARLDTATAVIARVRHDESVQRFSIQIGGQDVCSRDISGGRARRLDCSWTRGRAVPAPIEVLVRGPRSSWTLEYLELATHHGSSSGLLNLFVLPAGSERAVLPPLAWALAS